MLFTSQHGPSGHRSSNLASVLAEVVDMDMDMAQRIHRADCFNNIKHQLKLISGAKELGAVGLRDNWEGRSTRHSLHFT